MSNQLSFIPPKTVEVPEIPLKDRVQLQSDTTAVIVLDMQNDFVTPGGALVIPAAAATVPRIQQLLHSARTSGTHIVYVQDTHFQDDPEFQIWPEHCRIGT
jgi:nicotinamidase-related amidase